MSTDAIRLTAPKLPDSVDGRRGRNAVVELRVEISPAALLSIAAIVLAGAVVTGIAIREAKRPAIRP